MSIGGLAAKNDEAACDGGLVRYRKSSLAARGSLRALRLVHRRRRVGLPQRERIALGVRACREPTLGRNRHLLVGLPAQLAGLADRRVDVVGVEVDDRALFVGLCKDSDDGLSAVG